MWADDKQVHLHHWARGQLAQLPPSAKESPLAAQSNSRSRQRQMVTTFLGQCKVQWVGKESRAVRQQPKWRKSLGGVYQ